MTIFEIYLLSFLFLFTISIFVFYIFFAIYLIILLICSRGFKISPIVSSDAKSIKKISEYIAANTNLRNKKIKILDIGSGYGKMLFGINNKLKSDKVECTGYEISKFPYEVSKFFNKSKNIKLLNNDIFNLKDFDFDFVITFILKKQQKLFLEIYNKFPKGTIIIANSLPIPFDENNDFSLIEVIKVHYHWNIYIYKKLK